MITSVSSLQRSCTVTLSLCINQSFHFSWAAGDAVWCINGGSRPAYEFGAEQFFLAFRALTFRQQERGIKRFLVLVVSKGNPGPSRTVVSPAVHMVQWRLCNTDVVIIWKQSSQCITLHARADGVCIIVASGERQMGRFFCIVTGMHDIPENSE